MGEIISLCDLFPDRIALLARRVRRQDVTPLALEIRREIEGHLPGPLYCGTPSRLMSLEEWSVLAEHIRCTVFEIAAETQTDPETVFETYGPRLAEELRRISRRGRTDA